MLALDVVHSVFSLRVSRRQRNGHYNLFKSRSLKLFHYINIHSVCCKETVLLLSRETCLQLVLYYIANFFSQFLYLKKGIIDQEIVAEIKKLFLRDFSGEMGK